MSGNEIETTNRLLRVVIALQLRGKEEGRLSLRDQISVLSDLGLEPMEIAKIVNRTGNYINKELSGLRKTKRGKDG